MKRNLALLLSGLSILSSYEAFAGRVKYLHILPHYEHASFPRSPEELEILGKLKELLARDKQAYLAALKALDQSKEPGVIEFIDEDFARSLVAPSVVADPDQPLIDSLVISIEDDLKQDEEYHRNHPGGDRRTRYQIALATVESNGFDRNSHIAKQALKKYLPTSPATPAGPVLAAAAPVIPAAAVPVPSAAFQSGVRPSHAQTVRPGMIDLGDGYNQYAIKGLVAGEFAGTGCSFHSAEAIKLILSNFHEVLNNFNENKVDFFIRQQIAAIGRGCLSRGVVIQSCTDEKTKENLKKGTDLDQLRQTGRYKNLGLVAKPSSDRDAYLFFESDQLRTDLQEKLFKPRAITAKTTQIALFIIDGRTQALVNIDGTHAFFFDPHKSQFQVITLDGLFQWLRNAGFYEPTDENTGLQLFTNEVDLIDNRP